MQQILDVSLHDGTSEAVAAELLRKHIPYCLMSGWPDQEQLPPPLNRGRMLKKPYRDEDLVSTLEDLAILAQQQPSLTGIRLEGSPSDVPRSRTVLGAARRGHSIAPEDRKRLQVLGRSTQAESGLRRKRPNAG